MSDTDLESNIQFSSNQRIEMIIKKPQAEGILDQEHERWVEKIQVKDLLNKVKKLTS